MSEVATFHSVNKYPERSIRAASIGLFGPSKPGMIACLVLSQFCVIGGIWLRLKHWGTGPLLLAGKVGCVGALSAGFDRDKPQSGRLYHISAGILGLLGLTTVSWATTEALLGLRQVLGGAHWRQWGISLAGVQRVGFSLALPFGVGKAAMVFAEGANHNHPWARYRSNQIQEVFRYTLAKRESEEPFSVLGLAERLIEVFSSQSVAAQAEQDMQLGEYFLRDRAESNLEATYVSDRVAPRGETWDGSAAQAERYIRQNVSGETERLRLSPEHQEVILAFLQRRFPFLSDREIVELLLSNHCWQVPMELVVAALRRIGRLGALEVHLKETLASYQQVAEGQDLKTYYQKLVDDYPTIKGNPNKDPAGTRFWVNRYLRVRPSGPGIGNLLRLNNRLAKLGSEWGQGIDPTDPRGVADGLIRLKQLLPEYSQLIDQLYAAQLLLKCTEFDGKRGLMGHFQETFIENDISPIRSAAKDPGNEDPFIYFFAELAYIKLPEGTKPAYAQDLLRLALLGALDLSGVPATAGDSDKIYSGLEKLGITEARHLIAKGILKEGDTYASPEAYCHQVKERILRFRQSGTSAVPAATQQSQTTENPESATATSESADRTLTPAERGNLPSRALYWTIVKAQQALLLAFAAALLARIFSTGKKTFLASLGGGALLGIMLRGREESDLSIKFAHVIDYYRQKGLYQLGERLRVFGEGTAFDKGVTICIVHLLLTLPIAFRRYGTIPVAMPIGFVAAFTVANYGRRNEITGLAGWQVRRELGLALRRALNV